MNLTAAMTLGFTAIVSRWYLMLLAGKAWSRISKSDPEYAAALYTSGLDMAFYGIGPLNWRPLFRRPAPLELQAIVKRLRRAVLATFLLGVAALIYVPATFLYLVMGG